MNEPPLSVAGRIPEERPVAKPQGEATERPSAYPQHKRRVRPGWKATIVRCESFKTLRAIQKSTIDPAIDLSYLTDACLQLALELGAEAIVKRALEDLRRARPPRLTPNLSMEIKS